MKWETFGAIIFICFALLIWYCILLRRQKRTRKKLLKDYDETKDLSKLGEECGKKLREADAKTDTGRRGTSAGKPSVKESDRTFRREAVQIPAPVPSYKDSTSTRKTGKRFRGFFAKRKSRRK